MPRLTRKDMQQQTRARLLTAAEEEIVRKGIKDASIWDIAEKAEYSLGAFYSNFASKEMMLCELVELHMREEIQVFRKITAETGREKRRSLGQNFVLAEDVAEKQKPVRPCLRTTDICKPQPFIQKKIR